MMVTPLYAGLLAIWFFVLSMRVIARRRTGIPLGDGGDTTMLRRIRGHANFAEYVPIALVMMAMLELGRTSIYVLHALGIALLVARIFHGYSLSFTQKYFFGRLVGTVLTFIVLLAEAVLCIAQGIEGHLLWFAA